MSILNFKYKDSDYKISDKLCSYIEYCKMFKEYSKKIPEYRMIKEVCFSDESPKEELIQSLSKCLYFKIENNCINVSLKVTKKDIKAYEKEYKEEYYRFLSILKTYYINEQYTETIKSYLLKNNLEYILIDLDK